MEGFEPKKEKEQLFLPRWDSARSLSLAQGMLVVGMSRSAHGGCLIWV